MKKPDALIEIDAKTGSGVFFGRTARGEAVKKLGQAPRSYAKSLQNTDIRSEPVPFFHSLGARLPKLAWNR